MNCLCLCPVNHPDSVGICTTEATTEVIFTDFPRESMLSSVEKVRVRMCKECHDATLEKKPQIA